MKTKFQLMIFHRYALHQMLFLVKKLVNQIVLGVRLTNERRQALFPAGTIIRGSHHFESPTRREQDLN